MAAFEASKQVSEQRKFSISTGNIINSTLLDNVHQRSVSDSMSVVSQTSRSLDDLIDPRSSDVFAAVLEFENILIMEKSKLLTSLLKEEYEYYYERILHGKSRGRRNCSEDINFVIAAARMRIQWALEMIDANGKPGYGTLRNDIRSVGDFDECMDVDTGNDFDGRYCTTIIVILQINQTSFSPPVPISLGLCFPSSCDGQDVEEILNEYFLSRDDIIATAAQTTCQERHLELSTKAKIVISICSIFVTVLVVATIYDALYKNWWLTLNRNTYYDVDIDGQKRTTPYLTKKSYSEYEPILDRDNEKAKLYSPGESAFRENSKLKLLDQFLMSFSVYTNTSKLLSTYQPSGSIGCLHGMRFLSQTWIILVHIVPFTGKTIENIRVYIDDAYDRWAYMAVVKAEIAVDTFFAMSGLLMTYLVLKELSKKGPTIKFFANFYFHRVWRLLPPCMLIMMTYVPLIKYIGKGPFWPQGGFEVDECKDGWWYNMLYINNFIGFEKMCMGWTWYLANDMQFFIISPLMFLPLLYFGWKGLLSPMVLLVGCAICSGVITSANDFVTIEGLDSFLAGFTSDFFEDYYIKPYTRIGSYIVGLMTGFLLFKYEMKARLPKSVVIVGWMAATATALAVVYGNYGNIKTEDLPSTEVRALYNALSRIAWGMSVCWVIFACANGYGGFVNTLLSWKAFMPLSKLSYCAYLIHPIVIQYFAFTRGNLYHYDNITMTRDYLAVIFVTYMLAYVAYMAYEVPMIGLEKLVKGIKK